EIIHRLHRLEMSDWLLARSRLRRWVQLVEYGLQFALRHFVELWGGGAHGGVRDDAAMDEQLFVDVVVDAVALRCDAVDRRDGAVEQFAGGLLLAALEVLPHADERFGLRAEGHRAPC